MRVKSAPLNLILEANGKPTGDQLLAQQLAEAKAARQVVKELRQADMATLPKYLSSRQLQALRRTLRKGARDD